MLREKTVLGKMSNQMENIRKEVATDQCPEVSREQSMAHWMVGTQRVVSKGRVCYKSESFRDEWLPEVGISITVGECPTNPDRQGYPRNVLQRMLQALESMGDIVRDEVNSPCLRTRPPGYILAQ